LLKPCRTRASSRTAKASAWIFALTRGNATSPHKICKNGKHYTNWKNVPNKDKLMLLSHMNSTGLLWFDEETMKKHKIEIAPKYAYLLGNATGPKTKPAMSM
jgi:hypothetical protein